MRETSSIFFTGVAAGFGLWAGLSLLLRQRRRGQVTAPRRFGGAIKLKPEMYDRYTQLHDAVWEEVLERMHRSNMRNFTVYYHRETGTMFSHFEWVGHWYSGGSREDEDAMFDADMRKIASDPIVKEWWSYCEPCQEPFSQWPDGERPPSQGGNGEWWAPLICLTHCGHWPVEYAEANRDPDFIPRNPYGHTSTRSSPPPPYKHPKTREQ